MTSLLLGFQSEAVIPGNLVPAKAKGRGFNQVSTGFNLVDTPPFVSASFITQARKSRKRARALPEPYPWASTVQSWD